MLTSMNSPLEFTTMDSIPAKRTNLINYDNNDEIKNFKFINGILMKNRYYSNQNIMNYEEFIKYIRYKHK